MRSSPTQSIAPPHPSTGALGSPQRVKLADLMKRMREIEIDHEGKIYRLRLTQANKLILTA